ncbi:hypothetical protein PFISCL1PPCAC_4143, partial [Pristionchus fissidentatus]
NRPGYCYVKAREFDNSLSLDNIKQIRIESGFIDFDTLLFSEQLPNPQILHVTTHTEFEDNIQNPSTGWNPKIFSELPNFPVGGYVEMSVWMMAKD